MDLPSQRSEPAVTVVIPCRNENEHISTCLASVVGQQEVPGGFEILVADGMSDDGTRDILKKFARREPRLRIIDNPDRLTASAFNAAIRAARGRYIALMGAHAYYARDYLKSCLEVAQATGAENVGGAMTCVGRTRLQSAIAAAHHSPFSVGGARWHDPAYEGPADTVFGGFYRREIFDRIGLFDESLARNQDDEFNLRLTRRGGKIWHSPKIKSWYHPRASLAALFQQYLQYGYWKVRVVQKHRRPASIRHLVPAAFVGMFAALPLLGVFYSAAFWLWFALVGSYLCCDILAAAVTASRHGKKHFLLLPWVFPCYHFGYGIGFVVGMIHFVILRRGPSAAFTGLTRSSAPPLQQA